MFILRTVRKQGKDTLENNLVLGGHYNIIRKGLADEEFKRTTLECFKNEIDADKVFAYLIYDNGVGALPMYLSYEYYIMTDKGQTFSRERSWA